MLSVQNRQLGGTGSKPEITIVGDEEHDQPLLGLTTVSVVIPTLKHGESVARVLAKIPDDVLEIVLVDKGSSDDTVALARRCRPDVTVVEQPGGERGDALACGFWACSGEIIVVLDADGSTDPTEIPRFVAALLAGADFVKGSRFVAGGRRAGGRGRFRLPQRALSAVLSRVWKVSYSDPRHVYVAFWHHCLPLLFPDCKGPEAELLLGIRAARAGLLIHEVANVEPVSARRPEAAGTARKLARIFRTVAAECLRPS